MITTVVFDIGNVLVHYDWKSYVDSFGFSEEKSQAIANAMFLSEDWNEMDRGVLTIEECIARFISNAPEYAEDIPRVLAGMGACIKQCAYTKPWIRELREKGLRVYFLSNYGAYALEATKPELDFRSWMDGGLFSYEVQLIKPSRWIYAEFCRRFRVNPEEAVFFDDNEKNIVSARDFGMNAFVFTTYEKACEELKALGI
ncbi:MAG: HAD family phosphatase [Eubacteriales bacterium]|nr:HAD family phosphatase [Eubacteriales bacterium]